MAVPSYTPDPLLSEHERPTQRAAISDRQGQVLNFIKRSGKTIVGHHSFKYTPHLSMTVDRETLDVLLESPDVESLHEDIPVPPTLDLSVPRIGATQMHASDLNGAGVAVAILDTGVDKNHPFLNNSVVSEACYSSNYSSYGSSSICPGGVTDSTATGSAMPYGGNCPAGECSHGTHVAGIAAGRSGISGSPGPGVAPGANIIAIQVFSRFDGYYCGGGSCVLAWTSDIMKGLERVYALRSTYTIAAANLSLGGGASSSNCDSEPEKPIIDSLRAAGIATVIASGNNGYCGSISPPACISSAISVGATTDSDTVASYSNSASFMSLLAPGSSINSSVPLADGGGYQSWNGTSMATPHVTGAWALMKQSNPAATVTEILNTFTSTGQSITDSKCSSVTKKRINVYQAYQILSPKVATPTLSQPAGTYISTVTVSLSSTTSGATIRYTTNGTDPTSSSTQYSSPLTFTTTTTLKARAFKSGMTDSDVASATYTVKVATPTFSQPTGTYIETVTVSMSCTTSGATIRYTTNGTDPTSSSTQYSSPLTFTTTTNLKARAFKSGMTDSDVASATYTVKVATPTFSQPAGTYIETVTVSMSCTTSGATIRYTTNGTDPTSSSTQYSSPLTFTTTTTLKARAFKSGMADSDTATSIYTVLPTYQVTPSIGFGTGHGTITPDTAQTVPQGSTTSFTVTADTDYTASAGGTCGGTLVGTTYTINPVTANCSVIAGFTSTATCQSQPVRIVRTNTFYSTLQEAYDAALGNDTIQVQALTLIQNLTVNRNIAVTLEGGYPCNYGSNTGGMTTLKGWIRTLTGGGSLTIGNFNIKPNAQPPTATIDSATNVTANSATLNGTVKPNSAYTSYYFEWGPTTAYGTKNPLTAASAGKGSDDVAVSVDLTGLTPNTTYHYRLVAENSEGTTNGVDQTFTTLCAFTLSLTTATVTFSSGGYSVDVTTNSGCSWTATSNADWITISSGASGSESGTVNYTVSANPGKDKRTGTLTIAGQTLTVEQEGAPCSYALNSTSQSFSAASGTGSVTVTAPNGCTWSAVSNAFWISITSGGSGTGNGTVNYSVTAYNGTSSRSGTLTIAGQTFTVNQEKPVPLDCGGTSPVRNLRTTTSYGTLQEAYDASLNNDTIQAQAVILTGNLTVNWDISVTLEGGYSCDFGTETGLYTTLKGLIQTKSGGGTLTIGNFIIKANVQPPTATTGSVTNKTANSATLNGTVKPNSATTTYYFELGTTTAYGTKNPLTPASAGSGTSDVAVSADLTGLNPNTTYHYRLVAENSEGTTNGEDGTFTTPCVFTVSPTTQIVTSSSGTYSAAVTASNGCSWTAVRNDNWITITSGSSGTGNGTVNYTVSANPSKDKQTGTLTIAGQTLMVEQEGAPCSYSLSSTSQSVMAWGDTGSVGVTAVSGCTWSAVSNASWISIISGASGSGSGTVNYSVSANNEASSRSGTMTIAGQTFTVNQTGGPLTCGGWPVKNLNTGTTYAGLQEAYNAAFDGNTLQAQAVTQTGNLTANRDISITLEGGYSCDYGTFAGVMTTLKGYIQTMSGGGKLTIKNFELE